MKISGYLFVKKMEDLETMSIPDFSVENYTHANQILNGMKEKFHNITGYLYTLVKEGEEDVCDK